MASSATPSLYHAAGDGSSRVINTVTPFDPDTITGWGKRRMNWEFSTSVTQELMSRVSAELSYYRRAQGNFTTTDNQGITPADFDAFCVKAQVDAWLPNGRGYDVCGLYEQKATKFRSRVRGRPARDVRGQDAQWQADGSVQWRGLLGERARAQRSVRDGGFATGTTKFDQCNSYPDNPARGFGLVTGSTFSYCNYDKSWLTQVKATGSCTLPWQDIQLGGVMQNLPGQQITAQRAISSADALPSLGRAL